METYSRKHLLGLTVLPVPWQQAVRHGTGVVAEIYILIYKLQAKKHIGKFSSHFKPQSPTPVSQFLWEGHIHKSPKATFPEMFHQLTSIQTGTYATILVPVTQTPQSSLEDGSSELGKNRVYNVQQIFSLQE